MHHLGGLCLLVVVLLITLNMCISNCEARGGRGRGGGSFGGIFGGWRKYKKPSSGGNSRRTVNGSPVHTSATKSLNSGSMPSHSSSSSIKQTKQQSSYPKQQMPLGNGYTNYGNYYGHGGTGASHLPPGSTYYANTAALPQGAIYYAQPPMRSGMGDFVFGMMAGHMMSNMMFGPHHHISHVYRQSSDQTLQNNPKVIVVNNGEATLLNSSDISTMQETANNWPTETDTPLQPFNTSVTPVEAMQPGKKPIFQRVQFNNFPNAQIIQSEQQLQPKLSQQSEQTISISSQATESPSLPSSPPLNGIICMPILLNETDPNDQSKVQQVQRTLCFPAPPPPPPAESRMDLNSLANSNCVTRTFIETDPNDPTKTIEVLKEFCTTTTTTLVPPKVVGDIIEDIPTEVESTSKDENKQAQDADEVVSSEASTEGKFIRSLTTVNAPE